MIKSYFKIAWRKLVRDRQVTILNLTGLSTGLACSILIFLWVKDEVTVDKFHEKDSQLYKVMYNIQTADDILTLDHTPSPLADALVKEMPEVEQAVSVNSFFDWFAGEGVVSFEDKNVKVKGIFAGKDYFNVFSYRLMQGDKNLVLTDKKGVVISEQLAIKLFNTTENIIGKTVEWDHKMNLEGPFHITGVFENIPSNSTSQFDLIFNYEKLFEGDQYARDWTGAYAETFLILKKGTDAEHFNKKIANFSKSKDPANEKCTLFIQQFSKKYLYGRYENGVQVGGRIQYVKLFSIIGLFILIIACINFMNLTTAQASRKIKEIGVKKTLGANRKTLILQFLGESLLLTLSSLIISIGLIVLLLPQFNEITGKHLSLSLDVQAISSLLALTILVGLLSGCYPAFYLSGFNPAAVLKGKFNTAFGELWIRKSLVIFQFSLSVIFIIGFFVIGKQIEFIQTKNLGYHRDNIIHFLREGGIYKDPEVFLSALKNIPGVVNASCMPGSILDGSDAQSGFSWRGQKSDEAYLFKSPRVGYDVIETLGMEVLAGRSFSREFKDDESKIILNESAVKKMGLKSPIGKIIKTGKSESEIIGVVKDFQYGSLHDAIVPLIFRFRNSRVGNNVLVKIKAGNEKAAIREIEAQYKKFHPKYPFDFTFLDDDYQSLYASEQRIGSLSKYFAGLAILISCLGLFGLATFSAQKRQKEIAIRKIVGATATAVFALLSKDFLKLVLISVLVASPVAWWIMNNWLQNFTYRINISLWIFIVAALIALFIALVTISFQAIKAAIANPVKSLRTD